MADEKKKPLTAGERQTLLVEYQVCQSDSNAMIRTHWTVAGIFVAVSTGLLGWLIKSLVSDYINLDILGSIIVTIFSLSMMAVTFLLIGWLKRVNYLVHINNDRMRQIEERLGMQKNLMLPRDIGSEWIIVTIYSIFILLWFVIIATAWLFYH